MRKLNTATKPFPLSQTLSKKCLFVLANQNHSITRENFFFIHKNLFSLTKPAEPRNFFDAFINLQVHISVSVSDQYGQRPNTITQNLVTPKNTAQHPSILLIAWLLGWVGRAKTTTIVRVGGNHNNKNNTLQLNSLTYS